MAVSASLTLGFLDLAARELSGSGGMRTSCPSATRSAGFVFAPSRRNSPLRQPFSIRPWVSCGKRRLSQRSRRWSPSPAVQRSRSAPRSCRHPRQTRGPRSIARSDSIDRRQRHRGLRRVQCAPCPPPAAKHPAKTLEKVVNPPRTPVIIRKAIRPVADPLSCPATPRPARWQSCPAHVHREGAHGKRRPLSPTR